jgi:protein CpxP
MPRRNNLILSTVFCLAFSGLAFAQGPGGPPMDPGRPPMERSFHDGHFGRWWNDPRLAQQLNITDDQKHKMDDIFLQHRLNLIDLHAGLEKQEVVLRPMLEADQPDEAKVLSQIDAIAQARANLEKANARMLFDIRKVLTPDQWNKLRALRSEHHGPEGPRPMRRGPGNGRHSWRQHREGPPPPDGAAPPPPGAPDGDSGASPAPGPAPQSQPQSPQP